jgi:hypothetical protein
MHVDVSEMGFGEGQANEYPLSVTSLAPSEAHPFCLRAADIVTTTAVLLFNSTNLSPGPGYSHSLGEPQCPGLPQVILSIATCMLPPRQSSVHPSFSSSFGTSLTNHKSQDKIIMNFKTMTTEN